MARVIWALSRMLRRARSHHRYCRYWSALDRQERTRSAEELRAEQWERLKRLLEFAYERIPFYGDKFRSASITPDDIAGPDDLLRIPPLTKDEIRQGFPDRFVEAGCAYPPSMIGHSSGSTGESVYFVRPDDGWKYAWGHELVLRPRRLRNLPVLFFTTPVCMSQSCSIDEQGTAETFRIRKLHRIPPLRRLDHPVEVLPTSRNILCASDEHMDLVHRWLDAYSPCVMVVDPVYLASFARYLKRTGRAVPEVGAIISSYELLTGSVRDLLGEVFGCGIYARYASAEINGIAGECDEQTMHVRGHHVMVEAIRDGRRARPGELGKAVITDLSNTNMPLIRYEIGDIIAMGDGTCRCGRHTDTIEAIHGRAGDALRPEGPDGRRVVTPLQADEVFRGLGGVAAYRLVQTGPSQFEASIMSDSVPGPLDAEALQARCRSVLGEGCQLRVKTVDEIRPQASKKFRFVYPQVQASGAGSIG